MADHLKVQVSIAPMVTIADDPDANGKDVIHHDVKGRITFDMTVPASEASGTARWYYSESTTLTTTHADLIGGFGSGTTYTDGTAIDVNDEVMAYYVEHLNVDQNGVVSASGDYIATCENAGMPVNLVHSSSAFPGESIFRKCKQTNRPRIADVHAETFSSTAKVRVLAFVDDVA